MSIVPLRSMLGGFVMGVIAPTVSAQSIYAVADGLPAQAGWVNTTQAAGNGIGDCNATGQFASSTTADSIRLTASEFDRFTLAPRRVITRVEVDVLCRYNTGTTGNSVRFRVEGAGLDVHNTSNPWNQSATDDNCRWRFGGWDITNLRATWSASNINALSLSVRRWEGTSTLRVNGFRISVTTESDRDNDGVPDSIDGCPDDPAKTSPGVCGCGIPETDTDGDGTPDCIDGCPFDRNKVNPGICGCGIPETDTDGDGTPDCIDGCPFNRDRTSPGVCGCYWPDIDSDGDGVLNCLDGCPSDPNKTSPGLCGCGRVDDPTDSDADGVADCVDNCVGTYNPDQADYDLNGIGDSCDPVVFTAFGGESGWEYELRDCQNYEILSRSHDRGATSNSGRGIRTQTGGNLLGGRFAWLATAAIEQNDGWSLTMSSTRQAYFDGCGSFNVYAGVSGSLTVLRPVICDGAPPWFFPEGYVVGKRVTMHRRSFLGVDAFGGSFLLELRFRPATCLADFNGDDFIDFFDYSDFVDAFSRGWPIADSNADGFLDFFDYTAFVSAFEAGC